MALPSVSLMPEIPVLTAAQTDWCLRAVRVVVDADGVFAPEEQALMEQLASALGAEGVPEHRELTELGRPPEMTFVVEQFILRLLILAAHVDGQYVPEEDRALRVLADMLAVPKAALEVTTQEVRATVFLSTVLSNFEEIVLQSPRAKAVSASLGLSGDDAREALRSLRDEP